MTADAIARWAEMMLLVGRTRPEDASSSELARKRTRHSLASRLRSSEYAGKRAEAASACIRALPLQGAHISRVEGALLTLAPCSRFAAKFCLQSEAQSYAYKYSLSTGQALSPCQARQRTRRKVISML